MKQAAGILPYKKTNGQLLFFLVHPGGPFWKNKELGAWSIAKGEFDDTEIAFNAAIREFEEETGKRLAGDFMELAPVKLKSGKIIYAWAIQCDLDASAVTSNTFETEWPPKSGNRQTFPEVDKAAWFDAETAIEKIHPAQAGFIAQLVAKIQS
jgi:predicted NUDIX family NTP pyrophosphohydrolase